LPGTYALACCKKFVTYGRKKFYNIGPGLFKLVMSSPRAATSIHCFLACVSATLTGDNYPS